MSSQQKRGWWQRDFSRRQKAAQRKTPYGCQLGIELLEDRRMLSISWINRGNTFNDTDGFEAVFGPNAAAARAVADAAFATWSRVIQDFNNGTNNIDISLSIAGTGIGGSGGVSTISDGRPTSGTIGLAGGTDGLGGGYFIDPTPYDSSEFDGNITNAFVGNAKPGTEAADKADFFTLVLLETTHVLGTSKNPSLRIWTSGLMFNTNIPIPAGREEAGPGAGGLNNTYWLFDGPSIDVLFNGSANTGVPADLYNAVHTASPTDPPVVYNGNTYYGSEDDANAFYVNGERYIPSRNVARVLQDAYGYSIIDPGQFGTFYTRLDDDGTLEIRTPAGNSNDTLDLQISGGNLLVTLGLGAPVLRADPTTILSVLPINDINNIKIDMGDGADTVTIHSLYGSIPIALDMGSGGGNDVLNVWGGAGYDAITVNSPSLVSTGVTLTSFSGVEALNLYTNGGDADVYLPYGGSADTATINGSGSAENIILHSLGLFTPVTIFGNGGNDTITLAPNGGTDIIRAAVTVDGGTGADTLNLGNGTLASIVAPVTFNGGTGFEDKVVLNDQATTITTSYNVTSTAVTRSPTFGGLTYSDLDRIVINCGSGADTVSIANGVFPNVEAHGNNGNDNFIIGGGNLTGIQPQSFDGGDGFDQITFDNHLDSTNRIWDMRNNEIFFGGLIVLSTASFESVGVLGGSGQDEFDFKGVLGQGFNVDGGPNTDTFVLGFQGSVFFNNPVTLLGGDGGDVFTVNDAAVSAFTTPLVMDGGNDFNLMNVIEPLATGYIMGPGYFIPRTGFSNQGTFTFGNMLTTIFTGNSGDNDFTLYSAGVDFIGTFTINGGSGNDSFLLAPQPSGYTYKGLTINGQPGTDTLTLDASALTTDENYTIGTTTIQIASGAQTITSSSLDQITLTAGAGNDTISMNQYSAGTPVTVNGGGGNDTLNFGGGNLPANITNIGAFTFNGESGFDRFNLNNTVDFSEWQYIRDTGTIRVDRLAPFFGYIAILGETGIEEMTLNASSGVDRFYVRAVAAGASIILNAGGGLDGLFLADSTQNLAGIQGLVRYNAGAQGGNMLVTDNADTTGDTAHLTDTTLGAAPGDNLFGPGGSLEFHDLVGNVGEFPGIMLNLSSGADTIYAQPLASAQVTINAGNPTTAPGDTLHLALATAQNYSINGTPANGNVSSDNLRTLSYTGFETGPIIMTPPDLLGDYNQNNVVDAADYTLWRDTLGSAVTFYSGADGSGDGTIGPEDYDLWKLHFGQTLAGAGGGGAVTAAWVARPESSTGVVGVASDASATSFAKPQDVPPIRETRGAVRRGGLPLTSLGETRPRGVDPRQDAAAMYRSLQTARHDDALLAWMTRRDYSHANDDVGVEVGAEEESELAVGAVDEMFAVLESAW